MWVSIYILHQLIQCIYIISPVLESKFSSILTSSITSSISNIFKQLHYFVSNHLFIHDLEKIKNLQFSLRSEIKHVQYTYIYIVTN